MDKTEDKLDRKRRDLLRKAAFVVPMITSLSLSEITVAASGAANGGEEEYNYEEGEEEFYEEDGE